MTRYQRIAKRGVATWLAKRTEPVLLFSVSCIADKCAREAGKVRDLYYSLWDYEYILPAGWSIKMLKLGEGILGDALAMACPPGWQSGDSQSESLLLGRGALVEAKQGDLNL